MAGIRDVLVPAIGDFREVEIIEVMVKPGDHVKAEDTLITLESDKATVEVPSPASGVVKDLKVKIGDRVSEGSLILALESESEGETVTALPVVSPPPAPAHAPAGRAEIRVPDIGDFRDVPVIEVLVKEGDLVKPDDPLVTLESDKASIEVPAPLGGRVQEVKVKVGDRVSEGTIILNLVTESAIRHPEAAAAPTPDVLAPATTLPSAPALLIDEARFTLAYASPAVRKLARELGIDLGEVKGSGDKGRILKEDVELAARSAVSTPYTAVEPAAPARAVTVGEGLDLLPWPMVDFAKFGPIEAKPLSRIRKIAGANLHRNWVMIPHVTSHEDADITELEAFRVQINKELEKSGVKVSLLAFLMKASVKALKEFSEFNASLDGENLVLKKYYHIGFAADTPNGLVVPVVKDTDQKGVVQIAKEMSELAARAREGKLPPTDMQGGCFTISSLGGIGGTYFTPIINAPEVAILGVCRSSTRPVWDGKQFVPRLILPLSLSWDHRAIDGAAAARFNTYFANLLANMLRVML